MLKKLIINGKQKSSSPSIEMDAEVEALYADLEEIEHIVISLQMIHARPEEVMTDEFIAAMVRLKAVMANASVPPVGWSARHSAYLELALNCGETEIVTSLTDQLENLILVSPALKPNLRIVDRFEAQYPSSGLIGPAS